MKKITIGIPTYNRKNQLLHQLNNIKKQNLENVEEIIIIDNDSNYNIYEISNIELSTKIRIVKNKFNIKMATNMIMPFLYCKTEWLWLLSDDDEVLPNSIETILQAIQNSNNNTGLIKFAIDRENSHQRDEVANNLEEYIDYYYREKLIRRGDLVFISTNVFNLKNIKENIGSAFEYSYTYIGFLVPIFICLNSRKISVTFSSKPIVKYLPPREESSAIGSISRGLSIISHIPLSLSKEYKIKFYEISMLVTYVDMLKYILNNNKNVNIKDLYIVYNNIYKYYIQLHSKLVINIFIILFNINFVEKLLKKTYKNLKLIKWKLKIA